jgi:RNA 3'-terminal phosphate cyclase (ATP)
LIPPGGRAPDAGGLWLDGSQHSGSGTLVRFGVALAAVLGQRLRITGARAKRRQPGLRAQHVAAVRACAELCGGSAAGAEVGSQVLAFAPGDRIRGGSYRFEIGTAGSATMLALAVLPVACCADGPVAATIRGGTFQDFAPSAHHFAHVLLPTLAEMGIAAELELRRPGYPPGAVGELVLRVRPVRGVLEPLVRCEAGRVEAVEGIALASHLAERRVAARMAEACRTALAAAGLEASIRCIEDEAAARPGASLAVWATTSSGARIGADRAGARGRSSEAIGRFVARTLLEDLGTGAATDRHLADQLVVFAALAAGTSRFTVPSVTEHVESHVWLANRFGARARCDGRSVEVEGLGVRRG